MNGRSVSIAAKDFAGRTIRMTLGPIPGPNGEERIRIVAEGTMIYTSADDLAKACVWLFGQACEGKHARKGDK